MSSPVFRHDLQTDNHKLEAYTFADATARLAGTGYTIIAEDIGKSGFQADDLSYWRLTGVSPLTWHQISSGAFSAGGFTDENKDGVTVDAGMAVAAHSSGTGFLRANATDNTKNAIGLLQTDTASLSSGPVQVDGPFTLSDWTAVTGSATLAALGVYFLDTVAGKLTATPPSSGGNVVQKIGRAISPTTLEIEVEVAILL